jgi:hypothetical protein
MFSCVLAARPAGKKSHHEEHEGHEEPEGRPMHSALPVLIFPPFMSFMVYIFSFLVCSAMQLKISANHDRVCLPGPRPSVVVPNGARSAANA